MRRSHAASFRTSLAADRLGSCAAILSKSSCTRTFSVTGIPIAISKTWAGVFRATRARNRVSGQKG